MRVIGVITVRIGSSRLPGKALLPLYGKPSVVRVFERLVQVRGLDGVFAAIPDTHENDVLAAALEREHIPTFRGSEEDYMLRLKGVAQMASADAICWVTGDCPLMDPDIAGQMVDLFRKHSDWDYLSNIGSRSYPRGLDTQVFKVKMVDQIMRALPDLKDRVFGILAAGERLGTFTMNNMPAPEELFDPDLRITLDTAEDYATLLAIYAELYPKNPDFRIRDVLKLLDEQPELRLLNEDVQQKAY